jgi:hypothetical protein
MAQVLDSGARVGEFLDAAAAFFSECLWTSEIGASVLARIAREESMRRPYPRLT